MEETGRFNAGVGSVCRLDGTIEMDAAIADSSGLVRTVAVVRGIRNPVLLALALAKTAMRNIAGEGATQFGKDRGLESHPGPTERAKKRLRALKEDVRSSLARGIVPLGWTQEELQDLLHGGEDSNLVPVGNAYDTVGAIAYCQGKLALAASTGGSGLMRRGRVGDVPVRGAGFEMGSDAAVLATGVGEIIIDKMGSSAVRNLIGMGYPPQQACEAALVLFPTDVPVGFIAMTEKEVGIAANCPMSSHSIVL